LSIPGDFQPAVETIPDVPNSANPIRQQIHSIFVFSQHPRSLTFTFAIASRALTPLFIVVVAPSSERHHQGYSAETLLLLLLLLLLQHNNAVVAFAGHDIIDRRDQSQRYRS
jgi:hypothetical protein